MYQIVFTSNFIRNLSESTHAQARTVEPVDAPASPPAPAGAVRAGAGRPGLAQLAFGAALRLLGAH